MKRTSVVVVGGGPAGSTAAALLAREGVPVVLLERSKHPRHHVGESLQPASIQLLDQHFGLGPELAKAGYARKYGAVYVWGETREPWSVLFDDRLERELPDLTEERLLSGGYEHAWQVRRSTFDAMLFAEAARRGADVREDVDVADVLFEGDRAIGVRTSDGETLHADVVLDATGQRCLIGKKLGLAEDVGDMRATATYAYYDGAGGLPGALARHVQLVVTVPEGWVWFIPISPERTSVGVVLRERARLPKERFDRILAEAPIPMEGATLVTEEGQDIRHARDWSYACSRAAGPGWMLLGDAACFVDPILSGGVDFAIRGAANAAITTMRALDGTQPAGFADYDTQLRREYRAYLRLARYWYGNNRSVQGFFWEAHQEVAGDSLSTPLRAFVYLTSGRYAADAHKKVFTQWQEEKMFRALGVDKPGLAAALRNKAPTP